MASTNGGAPKQVSVAIVGAGFGGIGAAIKLGQAGIEDLTVYERGDSVGGVWRANTYPGAACDVPSHLYSFSFAPGHDWSRRYAPQAEILAYLKQVTKRFGVEPHLRLNTGLAAASFDPEAGRWRIETDDGETREVDVLITACGQLRTPAIPELPGLESFEGRAFHSAEWDHGHDLSGREVAVIGTGASAIQFVPEIAPLARRLTIYQRSAPWIIPKVDRAYPDWERRLFKRYPARVAVARAAMFAFFEALTYGFTGTRWVMAPFRAAANSARRRGLADPALRLAATPDYEIGCKRVLFTADWYSTLARDNVELISGAIERVTPGGVVDATGVERPAETIVFGTGFRSQEFVAPMRITGLEGQELSEFWSGRPEAFLGTTVSGFPNLFVLYGPNTNHGSGSVPYTLECQFSYMLDAVERLRAGARYVNLRPEAQDAWRREIAERSANTVWRAGGCGSWYLNGSGENVSNWPGPWLEFKRRTRRIDPAHYDLVH